MSYWWITYGKFAPDPSRLYPLAGQVVEHYRERAGLSREALATSLGIGAKAVYYAETKGSGLDSIARLRQLCTLLDVPLILFGLCTAPRGERWWIEAYWPWRAGLDGWPDSS